jgi:hypothetical protein
MLQGSIAPTHQKTEKEQGAHPIQSTTMYDSSKK